MSRNSEDSKPMSLSADAALLKRLQNGETAAFESIFHSYYPAIFRLLVGLLGSAADADDVAQEVFLKLYRRPLSADRQHNLGAWLYRVATRLGYNALRGQGRRHRREELWEHRRQADAGSGPEQNALQAETQTEVRQILAQLPFKQAQILFLRHHGLAYKEIAQIVGCKPGSVGTLLARAERAFEARYRETLPTTERRGDA